MIKLTKIQCEVTVADLAPRVGENQKATIVSEAVPSPLDTVYWHLNIDYVNSKKHGCHYQLSVSDSYGDYCHTVKGAVKTEPIRLKKLEYGKPITVHYGLANVECKVTLKKKD